VYLKSVKLTNIFGKILWRRFDLKNGGHTRLNLHQKLNPTKNVTKSGSLPYWFQFHLHLLSSFCWTKEFCAAFFFLQFGFLIFWQKNIGKNAAHHKISNSTLALTLSDAQAAIEKFFLPSRPKISLDICKVKF